MGFSHQIRTVGLVSLLLVCFGSASRAMPVLETRAGMTHPFGVIRQGALLTYSFDLVNAGDEPVKIMRIVPNLKLLKASLDKFTLQPGERATLKVEYDSRYGMGAVEPSLLIFSNCSVSPQMAFVLKGIVYNSVAVASAPIPISDSLMRPVILAVKSVWQIVSQFLGLR